MVMAALWLWLHLYYTLVLDDRDRQLVLSLLLLNALKLKPMKSVHFLINVRLIRFALPGSGQLLRKIKNIIKRCARCASVHP
jgi:hypothetical protein